MEILLKSLEQNPLLSQNLDHDTIWDPTAAFSQPAHTCRAAVRYEWRPQCRHRCRVASHGAVLQPWGTTGAIEIFEIAKPQAMGLCSCNHITTFFKGCCFGGFWSPNKSKTFLGGLLLKQQVMLIRVSDVEQDRGRGRKSGNSYTI